MEELLGAGEHQKNNNVAKNTHREKENKRHKWKDVSSNGGEKTIKPESAVILPRQAAREAQEYKHISMCISNFWIFWTTYHLQTVSPQAYRGQKVSTNRFHVSQISKQSQSFCSQLQSGP